MSSAVMRDRSVKPPAEKANFETLAYGQIKSAILQKELRPGEKISYTDWADRLKISRTPVRDALKRLEYEGFIVRETERYWHVYTLTIEEVESIFDTREAVDGKISYLAALRITPELVVELEQIHEAMEETRLHHDYETFYNINSNYHGLLNRASQNDYLVSVSKLLNEKLSRLYPKGINIDGRLEKGITENRLISDALIAHDPEAAERAQITHLRSYRSLLIMVLKEMVIPYTGPVF